MLAQPLVLTISSLGRSSSPSSDAPSLGIWTHKLKSQIFHSAFVPKSAPKGTKALQAVTLGAGEQWLDVYRAAAQQGRVVVGGHARTVGAVGGYLTGGGHGPFANKYGLAVDSAFFLVLISSSFHVLTVQTSLKPL